MVVPTSNIEEGVVGSVNFDKDKETTNKPLEDPREHNWKWVNLLIIKKLDLNTQGNNFFDGNLPETKGTTKGTYQLNYFHENNGRYTKKES